LNFIFWVSELFEHLIKISPRGRIIKWSELLMWLLKLNPLIKNIN